MRYILSLAFFAAFATSAHAQATGSDCSTADQPQKTWNQQPPGALCGTGRGATPAFTVYSTTVDTCTDQNTGSVYAQSVRQTTGNGLYQCWSSSSATPSMDLLCNPTITQEVTHATSSTDYNRFYLRAWDADPSKYCGTYTTMSRQDFWQCSGVDCPPPPPPPPPMDCGCETPGCCGSPIIIDTSGQGFYLTSAANGVAFDIFGTGHPVKMAWTAYGANNAFLALPGADGLVHNSKQLFGDFTPQPPSTTRNGFAALAVYDDPKNGGNGDGVIDSRDAVFASLRLWIDTNHDGISQPEELRTLPSLGVNSISLNYKESRKTDQYGNAFRYRARVNGNESQDVGQTAYDVFFVTSQHASKNIPRGLIPRDLIPADSDAHKCVVPVLAKGGMLSTSK